MTVLKLATTRFETNGLIQHLILYLSLYLILYLILKLEATMFGSILLYAITLNSSILLKRKRSKKNEKQAVQSRVHVKTTETLK